MKREPQQNLKKRTPPLKPLKHQVRTTTALADCTATPHKHIAYVQNCPHLRAVGERLIRLRTRPLLARLELVRDVLVLLVVLIALELDVDLATLGLRIRDGRPAPAVLAPARRALADAVALAASALAGDPRGVGFVAVVPEGVELVRGWCERGGRETNSM